MINLAILLFSIYLKRFCLYYWLNNCSMYVQKLKANKMLGRLSNYQFKGLKNWPKVIGDFLFTLKVSETVEYRNFVSFENCLELIDICS